MSPSGSTLRRSIPNPRAANPAPAIAQGGGRSVDALLLSLPSHGWTAGWTGRRDRALLVLWHRAGLSFADLATLTIDDIQVEEGVATVRTDAGEPVTLRMTEDCLLCGPCALVRWLHALDLSTLHSDGRVVASVIGRAAPLTAQSPHVCEGSTLSPADTGGLQVFPLRDQWTWALPAPAWPAHDLRLPSAPGPSRFQTAASSRSDHPRLDSNPVPADPSEALESRARALVGGVG